MNFALIPLSYYLVLSGVLFTIGTAGVFIRRNLITTPSDKFNFVDGTNYEVGGLTRIDGTQWLISGDNSASRGGSSHIAYRHGEMALNALHYDGHASYYPFAEAWPTTTAGQDRHWLIYPTVR